MRPRAASRRGEDHVPCFDVQEDSLPHPREHRLGAYSPAGADPAYQLLPAELRPGPVGRPWARDAGSTAARYAALAAPRRQPAIDVGPAGAWVWRTGSGRACCRCRRWSHILATALTWTPRRPAYRVAPAPMCSQPPSRGRSTAACAWLSSFSRIPAWNRRCSRPCRTSSRRPLALPLSMEDLSTCLCCVLAG